jgi:3-oxoacyl-[acyl-carrier-protein] synthase III
MESFVLNQHGRLVFPSNYFPDLDFSVFDDLDQFAAVIQRDFEDKAPTGTEIANGVAAGAYPGRYELLRDIALNIFWVNRYAMTMYEKRPTRWRDVPRLRDNVFLPILTKWADRDRKVAAVETGYAALPATWDDDAEDRIFKILFDVFQRREHDATDLAAIKPTVSEILADPRNLTFQLTTHDPDYALYSYEDIINCTEAIPELEALHRRAMVAHNQYPWNLSQARLSEVGKIRDDDFVVMFYPRDAEILQFIRRVKSGGRRRHRSPVPAVSQQPVRPFAPVETRKAFAIMPRIESVAVAKGERSCSNEDLVRNGAYNWSPMSADEIHSKTGIAARLYTSRHLEDISLEAAQEALEKAGREPREIGAVLFCSCTNTRLIPSVATWLSGQLGIYQTHSSCDLVAACAGLSYGLSEAVRLLQEVDRPILVVCAEKFSDKIGSVRPSRMIFGDGASAMVIGPAPPGTPPDIEVIQTYASGPISEVNSIIWPNEDFGNNITVYGPQVRALAQRYLIQMMDELRALPRLDGSPGSLLESIDLVVPHQANKSMVTELAQVAGLSPEQLYFNIEHVGNVSSASIPLAIFDAVAEGVIDRPMMVFAPGFGAGAVAGYSVMRIDPTVVAAGAPREPPEADYTLEIEAFTSGSEDVGAAFGG